MSIEALLGLGTAIGGGLLTKEAYDRLSTVGTQSIAGATLPDGTQIPGAAQIAAEGLGLSQFSRILLLLAQILHLVNS